MLGAEGRTITSPCFAFPAPLLPRLLSLSITLQHRHVTCVRLSCVVQCGSQSSKQFWPVTTLSVAAAAPAQAQLFPSRQVLCSSTSSQYALLQHHHPTADTAMPGGKVITISVPPATLRSAAGGPFSSRQLHCAGSSSQCCEPLLRPRHRTFYDPNSVRNGPDDCRAPPHAAGGPAAQEAASDPHLLRGKCANRGHRVLPGGESHSACHPLGLAS